MLSGGAADAIAAGRQDVAQQAQVLLARREESISHQQAELNHQRQTIFVFQSEVESFKHEEQAAESSAAQSHIDAHRLTQQLMSNEAQGTHNTSQLALAQETSRIYEQRAREDSDRAATNLVALQHESEALLQEQVKVVTCEQESQSEAIL